MEEIFIQNARAYASKHQLELGKRLGSGIHGIIFAAGNKFKSGKTAIKVHREAEPYLRERAVYERLKLAKVTGILGFNVPQFIRADDDLRFIEMSIVKQKLPILVDFLRQKLNILRNLIILHSTDENIQTGNALLI